MTRIKDKERIKTDMEREGKEELERIKIMEKLLKRIKRKEKIR